MIVLMKPLKKQKSLLKETKCLRGGNKQNRKYHQLLKIIHWNYKKNITKQMNCGYQIE